MKEMMIIMYKIHSILFLLLTVVMIQSCKKDEAKSPDLSRMFMPGGEISSLGGQTFVKLSWQAPSFTGRSDSVSYTIEVSQDSTFQVPVEFSAVADSTGITITDENITVRRKYFARIKANGKGHTADSKWLVSTGFAIPGMQLFRSVQTVEQSAILNWEKRAGITKLSIIPESGTSFELPVTINDTDAADPSRGSKRIDGLAPGRKYAAELFSGKVSNGFVIFMTENAVNSANLVDLSASDDPAVLMNKLINKEIPAGGTVLLKRGMTYNLSSEVLLDRPVVITSRSSFDSQPPVIFFTSNLNVAEGNSIDSVIFRHVILRGSDNTAKYIFNVNKASSIGKVVFESCTLETVRGIMRLQNVATSVNSFSINNSLINNIGSYGILTVDGAIPVVANIAVKNSTIFKAEKIIVSKQNSNAVNLESCTIYNAPASGNYLIDYSQSGTNNVAAGIKISGCIIGPGLAGSSVKGIRAGSSTLISASATYKTADYTVSSGEIGGLALYDKRGADLFMDPADGNFRIKDGSFAGKLTAGDPRWR